MTVQSLRVTLAGVDFTDASDDADRVFEVCDDVLLSREPPGMLRSSTGRGRASRPRWAVRWPTSSEPYRTHRSCASNRRRWLESCRSPAEPARPRTTVSAGRDPQPQNES